MAQSALKRIQITSGIAVLLACRSFGGAIVPGFDSNLGYPTDDGYIGSVPLSFTAGASGFRYDSLFINNNGNVTFGSPLSTYTPFSLSQPGFAIIAPFFADVDTRNPASGVVRYGPGLFEGRNAFGVNWIDVGYYDWRADRTNSFQFILVDRGDTGLNNFDIVFNYDRILWETGDASDGVLGLGGKSARVGFALSPGVSYEFFGSGTNGAFLDGGPYSLVANSLHANVAGRYVFEFRDGSPVPEPSNLMLLALGLLPLAWRMLHPCSRTRGATKAG